jgi:ubiquinone/menaquinone biosynthesis C-methylase UbiE
MLAGYYGQEMCPPEWYINELSRGVEGLMTENGGGDSAHKERVRSQFGSIAAEYVSSPGHRSGRDLDRLVEMARCKPTDHALDVATGGGHTALALAPHVDTVVSSDLTPKMLDAAREFIQSQGVDNVTFDIADAEHLPFPDGSFDIVSCRIAPHHFGDVQAFCNEVSRVLRPGGRFVLMDSVSPDDDVLDAFINELEWRRDTTHVRSYSVAEWHAFIEASGMAIEEIEFVTREHDYPTWTARSRMTAEARAGLDQFVLGQPDRVLDYFGVRTDGEAILSFTDHKVLIQSIKH